MPDDDQLFPPATDESSIVALTALIQRTQASERYWSDKPARGGLTSTLRAATRHLERARHAIQTAKMMEGQ